MEKLIKILEAEDAAREAAAREAAEREAREAELERLRQEAEDKILQEA